jgi:hypothetical protein
MAKNKRKLKPGQVWANTRINPQGRTKAASQAKDRLRRGLAVIQEGTFDVASPPTNAIHAQAHGDTLTGQERDHSSVFDDTQEHVSPLQRVRTPRSTPRRRSKKKKGI